MKILVVNDDGIASKGLLALYQAMKEFGKVTVVAPDCEQSASSHCITIDSPIRVKDHIFSDGVIGYAVGGTPADCTKIAFKKLLSEPPDIVVSGINQGANLGLSIIYSGTVSAATEGCILGVPSIAISLASFAPGGDFTLSQQIAKKLVKFVFEAGLPEDILLNVNVPPIPKSEMKGIKITTQSKSRFVEYFEHRKDPQDRSYYWLSGNVLESSYEKQLDDCVVRDGYVSVTPLKVDRTAHECMDKLKILEKDSFG